MPQYTLLILRERLITMNALFNLILFGAVFPSPIWSDKITNDVLENYSSFFNFGDRKLTKLRKDNLANDVLKSKVDVLGEVFKKNIDSLKLWGKLDVIFLIDASSSVGEENFKSEIKFVKKLLSDVTVDYDHTRIAIVTFSSKNSVIKNVDEITVPRKENNKCLLLNNELGNITYTGGGTYTIGAFQVAKGIFEKSRNESKKVLFLITDGYSNGGNPVPIANELKKNQVTIFTIGVKNGNYEELYQLSTSPGELYSYLLDSFQEFEGLARRALHVDIKSGDYVPLGTNFLCNRLCEEGNCCDDNALCTCGTSTGHYTCLCKLGYYGSGLKNSCSPCPPGTFADEPNLCLPCPDIQHTTIPPATSLQSCQCKPGYKAVKQFGCEMIKCINLSAPTHGYFVKRKECGNVLNTACGVRCEVGYTLIGSSIRLCRSNGNWSGSSPSCLVKTCSALVAPLYGSISCAHEDLEVTYNTSEASLPVDTVCTFTCDKDRILTGSNQRTCLPLAQWDGLRTSCKQVKCNKLSNIPNAKIEPKSCALNKQALGTNCTFICEKGYKLSGPSTRSCSGKHGTWSRRSQQTTCDDVTPPILTCPRNLIGNTSIKRKFGSVFWEIPKVSDNSGLNVSLWSKPAIGNITAFKFPIGITTVTYFAQDAFKNKAFCNFTVEIIDNEPPIVENCIDPVTFLSMEQTGVDITWDEPNFVDNSGNVMVEKSHKFGMFKLGLTMVTYTAMDPSNNTNECVLNITVQESQCEALPDPIFGRSNCTSRDFGIQCVVTCQEGYAIPISSSLDTIDVDNSSTEFMCEHSDPVWYSQEDSIFPDCTVTEIPKEVSQKGTITFQANLEQCNDTAFLEDIENDIRNTIEESCSSGSCKVNATANCENDGDSAFEERTNIIKREIPATGKLNRTQKKKRVDVDFEVSAKVAHAKDLEAKLTTLSQITTLPFLKGNEIASVVNVKMQKINMLCPMGFVRKNRKCVQCPKGTFHNVTSSSCQSCPLGYYNDKFAQISCISCPVNHSTTKMHCKSPKDCKAHCPPGTHSRIKRLKPSRHHPNTTIDHMTLMPRCRACPIGHYQPNYGQLSCHACPVELTTNSKHSIGVDQCIPKPRHICDSSTETCYKGKCIVENEFSYSCMCESNYVGSHCETMLDSCWSNPCLNNAICNSNPNGFSCECQEGFTGTVCEEIECSRPCYSNGECVRNDDGEEICICPEGFGGDSCEIKLTFCNGNICENNGKCLDQLNGYRCVCKNGFIGKRCNILPCDYKPCAENLMCVNLNHTNATRFSYICECPKGYQGKDCRDNIDFCQHNPCYNNGICTDLQETFSCACPRAFYGDKCQFRRNGDYILNFPRSGTTDYVKLDGFADNLSEITVCLWMLTFDSFNYGTVFSYATYDYDNTFTLTDYTGLVLYVNGYYAITDIFLNDGIWHFLCVTWQSSEGAYTIYLDGKRVQNGTGLAQNQKIEGGGKLVIGQEQDVLGGRFSQSESFLGKIAYLDIWKRALTPYEIEEYMKICSENIFGDVLAWAEIKDFVHGDVEILDSTFCKACAGPKKLLNGIVKVFDNVAYYTCDPGFILTEHRYLSGRNCSKASKWEGFNEPECRKVHCGHPGYLVYGQTSGKGHYYMDRIEHVCDEGYDLVGSNTRICTEEGRWSPEKPSCIGVQCKQFQLPKNAKMEVLTDLLDDDEIDFNVGIQIEILCFNDTKIEGQSFLTCLENGTWDYPPPTCVKEIQPSQIYLACPIEQIPQPPENGYAVLESLYAYGNATTDSIEFKCRQGYHLYGDNETTCIVDGYWTEPNVSCDPILCPKPPQLPQMTIKNAHLFNGSYHFGNMVTFQCEEGYRIFGNSNIRCLANGRWTKMQAKCTRQSCYKPAVKETTSVEGNSYLYRDNVTLICASNERFFISCDSSGQWIGERGMNC